MSLTATATSSSLCPSPAPRGVALPALELTWPCPPPTPGCLPRAASILLGPRPTPLLRDWGSQHLGTFGLQSILFGPLMSAWIDFKLSIWSSAPFSSPCATPFPPAPSPRTLREELGGPTATPTTCCEAQHAQDPARTRSPNTRRPQSPLSPPLPSLLNTAWWVHPTPTSSERTFPPHPGLSCQTPDSTHPWLPWAPPSALWNVFTQVPLSLPGTLPFPQSWARMGMQRTAGVSSVHSCSLQGQFQKYESQFPLGPVHGAEMIVWRLRLPPPQ